ncbi:MAG: DUF3035 domain-containing protein [Alphaproteobacteria bacterium]|nr:DUF3035 domain-containing protein [Alphaproteobacteria bacterium]MBQ7284955.1 DUF3035 domain-containing protein [Alphaproteobacteria bacterium]
MKKVIFALVLTVILSGCGLTKEKLGIARKAPDENMVTVRQPLSVPPEYDLRPVAEIQQGK